MMGTQDPLTDLPPPSRFDLDELSNFSFHGLHTPPPPYISLDDHRHGLGQLPLRPSILIVSASSASFHLFHNLHDKLPLGSIVLPPSPSPPLPDSSSPPQDPSLRSEIVCDLCYLSKDEGKTSAVVMSVPKSVPEERTYALAKLLLDSIVPERLLILASVQMENFRGRLTADDHAIFRMETATQRSEKGADRTNLEDFPYFPSGSVVSGLPAAILTRCHIHGIKARALFSWPDSGPSAPTRLVSALKRFSETKNTDFSSSLTVPFRKKSVSDLDIYL